MPPADLELPCTGKVLYEWARGIEKAICAELDSFGPMQVTALPGHDVLFALCVIRPDALTIDDRPVARRIVIMMDDIHMLTSSQRALLVQRVIEARSTHRHLDSGAVRGAEYSGTPCLRLRRGTGSPSSQSRLNGTGAASTSDSKNT